MPSLHCQGSLQHRLGVEFLPRGKGIARRALQDDRHDPVNIVIALIDLACSVKLVPLIENINDHLEMCEAIWDQLNTGSTKLGPTKVLKRFTASRSLPNRTVPQYPTNLIALCKKLIITSENITNDTMKTPIINTLSNSYETIIQILEQRIPTPTAQQSMDAIWQYGK